MTHETDPGNPASPSTPPTKARRRLLIGGAGAVAMVAGAGYSWFRTSGAGTGAASEAASLLASQEFDTPTGEKLVFKSFQGRPLVVNFWATWCPPCIEEFPMIDRFYRENTSKRWQVVGLAIDQPSLVKAFLQKTPVSFPIGLAGLGGTELGKALGNVTGGLPFTIVLDAKGGLVQRKMGKLSPEDLQAWAQIT